LLLKVSRSFGQQTVGLAMAPATAYLLTLAIHCALF